MNVRRFTRLTPVSLITLIVALASSPASSQAASSGIQLKRIGHPIWKPADCHLFAAPVGTASTGYAEAFDSFASLLPPPNHEVFPSIGVGPGAPHLPPYTSELSQGVADQGFHEGHQFSQAEFSSGTGVFLVCMVIPAPGTTGSSPDFAAGPIIPNSLFPIHLVAIAYHNGQVFDPFLSDFEVPPLTTAIDPRFNVEGPSHFPFFVATNQDFGPQGQALRGRYEYAIRMTDATGQGWTLSAHFVIQP